MKLFAVLAGASLALLMVGPAAAKPARHVHHAAGRHYAQFTYDYRSASPVREEFIGAPLFQGGLRMGYIWDKYEVAAFCRNCTNEIRVVGGINFDNATGMINDPRIIGGQVSVKF